MAKHRLPLIKDTIDSVLKGNRGYPDVKWLAEYRGISQQEAYEEIIKHSEETNWEAMGKIKPDLPDRPLPQKTPRSLHFGDKSNIEHFHDLPKEILKYLFAILSLFAGVRSWGFIYAWFAQWDSGFFSVIMATILTGAMIALPQAAIIFRKEKRHFMFVICAFIICIAISFSMVTTIAGLYNDRSMSVEANSKAQAANSQNKDEIDRIEQQMQKIASDKMLDTNELATLQEKLKKYEPGTMEYNRVVNRSDNLKLRIDGYNNTSAMMQSRLDSKLDNKVYIIQRPDFFTYLQTVTGIKRDESEFGISIVVSIIVDIAGPVFATIALFL